MNLRLFPLLALACALPLAACAAPEGYPSLAVRDSERVSGSFDAPSSPAFIPTATAPATIAELGELAEMAREAHASFLAQAGEARRPVANAAGAARGSLEWSAAQVAIARLESTRSNALVALADIDRLYVAAALEGGELERLAAARDEVAALVEQEERLLTEMLATLGS